MVCFPCHLLDGFLLYEEFVDDDCLVRHRRSHVMYDASSWEGLLVLFFPRLDIVAYRCGGYLQQYGNFGVGQNAVLLIGLRE